MTQPQAPQQPELTPEQIQALQELHQMVAGVTRGLKKMKEAAQFSLEASKGPIAFAGQKAEEMKRALAALESKKGEPAYAYAKSGLTIALRMFEGSKRMMEIQNQYDQKNLEMAEQALQTAEQAGQDPNVWVKLQESGAMDAVKFALPLDDVGYLEARAQTNLYFALNHWFACIDGIDAVMRATVGDTAIEIQNAEEEAGRVRMAQVVKDAMNADPELAVLLTKLGGEFQEAYAFFEWGARNLKGLAGKPLEAKKQLLLDADWQKLNGKAVLLAGLLPQLKPFPQVAQFFPEPAVPQVPFEQLEWKAAGTGRLQGGTGRLPGGTGRLQGTGRLPGKNP